MARQRSLIQCKRCHGWTREAKDGLCFICTRAKAEQAEIAEIRDALTHGAPEKEIAEKMDWLEKDD